MKAVGIFVAFIALFTLGYLAVGFTSGITAPENTTAAGQQYENLSKVTDIADAGINSTLLIFIAAMVLSAVLFLFHTVSKKR